MSTIYWIETFTAICLVFIILAIIFAIFGFVTFTSGMEDKDDKLTSCGKKSLIASLFLLIAFAFMPSTSTGYKILGIGGTIDYLKGNDTAKQLPDKCIKALDMLLEKQMDKVENDSIK